MRLRPCHVVLSTTDPDPVGLNEVLAASQLRDVFDQRLPPPIHPCLVHAHAPRLTARQNQGVHSWQRQCLRLGVSHRCSAFQRGDLDLVPPVRAAKSSGRCVQAKRQQCGLPDP